MDNPFERILYNSIGKDEFELFQAFLAEKSGIVVPPEKAYLFETRLSKMMAEAGCETFRELHAYILSGADPQAVEKMINAMTTNETLWFRDASPWKAMEDKLLPGLIGALQSGNKSRVRIWFAAVSTGQEAYSTAMLIDDYLRRNEIKGVGLSNFQFVATDISSRVLDLAKTGRYDAISMRRGLSDYYREKYFIGDGSAWFIDPKIRDAVNFSRYNLQNDFYRFGSFDIIFCRYVLIYFSQELKKSIISRLAGSLADGGALFVDGYTIYDLFEEAFEINHHDTFTYYTKKAVIK